MKCDACELEKSGITSMAAGTVCSKCINEAVKIYLQKISLAKDMKKEDNNSLGAWWA